ncbi:perlucin-like protein [Macrobrachium nipponense]|uniref:perlucin-like protein n=1 Tax=Macrobrachium nipponense TaxID=159736 RepID=UPI0030C8B473
MECSSMAVASCFRLLTTILLLAMAGRCSSQQMDHIQLSRIADSIDDLTQVVQAQTVAIERFTSGIMKMFTLMATDHLLCERGWFKLRSSCYFISEDTSTWEESRQKCIALNSDLVKITYNTDYNFLGNLAKGHHTYIGLSDLQEEGTYRWVADGTIHQIVKSWWSEGEPNNANSGEHCVHYRSTNDGLNDVSCDQKFRYICEKPARNLASVPDEKTPAEK